MAKKKARKKHPTKRAKIQRPIKRRKAATTQGRGSRRKAKSNKTRPRRRQTKARVKPPRAKTRIRSPKRIRSYVLPRKGISSGFRKFVTSPRSGKANPTFAIAVFRFDYGGRVSTFHVPVAMGPMTKAAIRRLTFADVEESASFSTGLQRGEMVAVLGFAQLRPRRERRGKTFRKAKKRRR